MRETVALATLVCLVYLAFVYLSYGVLVVVALLDNAVRTRDARAERHDAVEGSRFTIPVSVLVPVFNEAQVIADVVMQLRALRYPELEILIVDDGSTDDTVAVLNELLELRPIARFERRTLATEQVRNRSRSEVDTRVVVIEKDNGGKADALNCALNHARYRYVCCVDGDTLYAPDALLNNMRLVMRDPARVIGITGHIAVATRPERNIGHREGHAVIESRLIANFQHMDYLRTFLNNRLAWSRLNFMLCASGAFAIWRRDVLVELGGFSRDFTCEDIEITFRAHEHFRRTGRDYLILSTPTIVARTEGPATPGSLISQRERWQRATLETLWSYRRLLFRRSYGIVGLIGVPFYVATEVIAPVVEIVALLTLVAGVWLHLFDWRLYLVFLASVAFANALLTTVAVLMEDISTRAYRLGHLARLIALGPAELVLYRPLVTWARFLGCWRFFRRERAWNKVERNVRPAEG